jgi:dTMP kinase
MDKGYFISFEGNETAGKTTQAALLCEALQKDGFETVAVREPGGTGIGESIRSILKNPTYAEMALPTELLLFAAARAQLVQEVIRPALAEGKIVVADRFHDSTTVYQGIVREQPILALQTITDFACHKLEPDLTLLLHVELDTIHKRLAQRGGQLDRFEQEGDPFFQKVRDGYQYLATVNARRIRPIITDPLTIEEVAEASRCLTNRGIQTSGRAVLRNGILGSWG